MKTAEIIDNSLRVSLNIGNQIVDIRLCDFIDCENDCPFHDECCFYNSDKYLYDIKHIKILDGKEIIEVNIGELCASIGEYAAFEGFGCIEHIWPDPKDMEELKKILDDDNKREIDLL